MVAISTKLTRFVVCILTVLTVACAHHEDRPQPTSWNEKTAAAYLDQRETWWMTWTGASRDHDTFCISCHTPLPYVLARPALRASLGESGLSSNEQKLVANVTKRVRLWKSIGPYYSDHGYDGKAAESRGTESVLNAMILANYDAQQGKLSGDTRAAFANMWSTQQAEGDAGGAWLWLQFDQEPWEAKDSGYYGACLAAMAVGIAPENYRSAPAIQGSLDALRQYLNRSRDAQSGINRIFLLWASTKLPGVLDAAQQQTIIQEVFRQQQSDGGWRLASMAWRWNGWTLKSLINMWLREDGTPMEGKSDGVATALSTLVLQEAGVSSDDPRLKRGLSWLMTHQDPNEGFWPASSVNKRCHISSGTGRFMSDAATAYAVLSLTRNRSVANPLVPAGVAH